MEYYIDNITPMVLETVKEDPAINKNFFNIDKSLIERIQPVPKTYIDIDTKIDKEQIRARNNI